MTDTSFLTGSRWFDHCGEPGKCHGTHLFPQLGGLRCEENSRWKLRGDLGTDFQGDDSGGETPRVVFF